MKQIVITEYGKPDVLKIREREDPEPGKGNVRIRVRAAGINFADILARQGLYPDAPKAPCVVGYEVAGVIDKIGPDVDPAWLEKPVISMTRFNGYSDVVVQSVENVFEKPDTLSFEQAAAIPINYLTAYQLVVAVGALKDYETILIHNAGGGVGLAVLELAKHIGAHTIGTASSHKHSFLRERGLDHAIDYRAQNWFAAVMDYTDNQGVELVIDPLGGQNWKMSYRALRHTGRLGMFGISTVTESGLKGKLKFLRVIFNMTLFNPPGLMNRNRGVFGVNLGRMWHEGEKATLWFRELLTGVNEGWINPHVDRSFAFSEAAEAHAYIEDRKNIGKIVLIP